MFLSNPGVLAAGAQGRTYAEFVAHITALATGSVGWFNASIFSGAATAQAQTESPAPYGMQGSSWLSVYRTSSIWCRVIQHGLPSEAELNAQVSAGRLIFLRTTTRSNSAVQGLDRNGFSSSSAASGAVRSLDELIYWDGERAQRMQPFIGLGPEPYDW